AGWAANLAAPNVGPAFLTVEQCLAGIHLLTVVRHCQQSGAVTAVDEDKAVFDLPESTGPV
ncbi:hypothetical protein, partial [Stenotrophomonas maltophilia]|uniref:hypothetical protein n=1 Tax=Stenotrophomonas maltophilia TaxID=40324 RepID=UPI001953A10D